MVGVNKWREATLLCGPNLDTSFTQGKGADQKKKKKKHMAIQISHIYTCVCVCVCVYKTKVIKESNLDMPIA